MKRLILASAISAGLVVASFSVSASSHREAPEIIKTPLVDNTDLYMFNSYESGREGFVTIIANYIPFQDPFGGPNYFPFDEDARYEIHIDNNGDAKSDLTFRFTFENMLRGIALDIAGKSVQIPLIPAGPIDLDAGTTAESGTETLNRIENYRAELIRGQDSGPGLSEHAQLIRWRSPRQITRMGSGSNLDVFRKPVDNIGEKTIADYETYAERHIYDVEFPLCTGGGRLFVGQRKESFAVAVGKIFDLINLNPLGDPAALPNELQHKNITTIALEVPAACLATSGPVIGAWATASLSQVSMIGPGQGNNQGGMRDAGPYRQVSRLGNPLVNEVVIGMPDKDTFNASKPADDAQFLTYVTHPTVPALIEILFPVKAPTAIPRQDLVQVFLTGVPGLNQPDNVTPSEMMRLNTSTPAVAAAQQNSLGVLGGDVAGYPNGRRPGDDVVDITLRAAMGALLSEADAPDGQLPYTDGVPIDASKFDQRFPYLTTPLPGSGHPFGDDADSDD